MPIDGIFENGRRIIQPQTCLQFNWQLLPAGEYDSDLGDKIRAYRKTVENIVNGPPADASRYKGEWFSTIAFCTLFAPLWHKELNKRGFNVQLPNPKDETGTWDDYFEHQCVIDPSLGLGKEIIIDPTYLQFFKVIDGRLPKVFVGTKADMIELLLENRDNINNKTIRENIESFVEIFYSLH